MGATGRALSAHHTLEPTQAGRRRANTQGGRDESLSEHGRWLVCWPLGKWYFSGMKSKDGGGQMMVLVGWRRGSAPRASSGHFGELVSSLARREARVSGWPHSRLGVCSHADPAGPGQTFSTTAFHADPPAEGPPRAWEGRVLCGDRPWADPHVGVCTCSGPSQWGVWTGIKSEPEGRRWTHVGALL